MLLKKSAPEVLWKIEDLPLGSFKYCSRGFAEQLLPPTVMRFMDLMAEGWKGDLRFSYICMDLKVGQSIDARVTHTDGLGTDDEAHRLFTMGGVPPVVGNDGPPMENGWVWEYPGTLKHTPRRTKERGTRLLLRVSRTSLPFRERETEKLRRRRKC